MTETTLLLRQVHPSWIHDGRVSSQAFRPTPKAEKRLSVYDGDKISAEKAWLHFTDKLECESAGVMAVTVQNCHAQNLPVSPDPEPYPEHVVIDFTEFSEKQIKSKAKLLKADAESRGWLYRV